MASFFQGSATFSHSSKIPKKATSEQAVAMLHDHQFFLQCNPHLSHVEPLSPSSAPDLPEKIKSVAQADTKSFSITDIVHTIPAGIWDSKVVSTYEITNTVDGLFVRIKSPLSIVMDTTWSIRRNETDGEWEISEEMEIRCSRLLVGVVKSQCEGGCEIIHGKMRERLEREVEGIQTP